MSSWIGTRILERYSRISRSALARCRLAFLGTVSSNGDVGCLLKGHQPASAGDWAEGEHSKAAASRKDAPGARGMEPQLPEERLPLLLPLRLLLLVLVRRCTIAVVVASRGRDIHSLARHPCC